MLRPISATNPALTSASTGVSLWPLQLWPVPQEVRHPSTLHHSSVYNSAHGQLAYQDLDRWALAVMALTLVVATVADLTGRLNTWYPPGWR